MRDRSLKKARLLEPFAFPTWPTRVSCACLGRALYLVSWQENPRQESGIAAATTIHICI
jgi:hypothetical protein